MRPVAFLVCASLLGAPSAAVAQTVADAAPEDPPDIRFVLNATSPILLPPSAAPASGAKGADATLAPRPSMRMGLAALNWPDRQASQTALGGQFDYSMRLDPRSPREDQPEVISMTARYALDPAAGFGRVAVFGGTNKNDEGDVYRLGSEVSAGAATLGVDFGYEATSETPFSSGVYLDVAVNTAMTVGLTGRLEGGASVGLGAALEAGTGARLSGEISAPVGDRGTPVLGMSLGFQF